MDSRQDTFIILTPAFAAYEGDSWLPAQENFVLALNRNFPSLRVVILTFHFPLTKHDRYTWYGNEVVTFNGGMKSKIQTLFRWRRVWNELMKLRKQQVIGIFSFFCSECAFVGHYFAMRFGLCHRIWILGQDARKENKQVGRIRPSADELICISDFLLREFERNHHIRPLHMVPIGIDVTSFETITVPRTVDILGAGSLIPLKQYDIFIDVVRKIAQILPNINAIICGDGPEKEHLHLQIVESGLGQHFELTGRQSHAALLRTMQRSKILLHTSSYEGFGAVCIEALYAGAHVISFCRPMESAIPHWHIVDSSDEMAAKAIELLLASDLDHTRILPYEINEIAIEVMTLFNYRLESTS